MSQGVECYSCLPKTAWPPTSAREVTTAARVEFERTWGVDPSTQIAIEWHIARWTPGIRLRDVGVELTPLDWEQRLDPGISNPTTL